MKTTRDISELEAEMLNAYFFQMLGEIDELKKSQVLDKIEIVSLKRGEQLFAQGDEADAIYTLLTGKLEAVVTSKSGVPKRVGMIDRSETVGEMALITGDKRSAAIIAMRNSTMARLSSDDFLELCLANPQYALNVSKIVVRRLSDSIGHKKTKIVHRTIAFYGERSEQVSSSLSQFIAVLSASEDTRLIQADTIEKVIGEPLQDTYNSKHVALWDAYINDLEIENDRLLLSFKGLPSQWIKLLMDYVDLCVIFESRASLVCKPDLQSFYQENSELQDKLRLVICHAGDTDIPRQTRLFLNNRPAMPHAHIREQNIRDMGRLHRYIEGRSNALVLGGGGAKGLAHVGVLSALQNKGIPIDYIAGTSMGSIVACLYAQYQDADKLAEATRDIFLSNPTATSDMSVPPKYSLYKGKRIDKHIKKYTGDLHVEDLWLPFFCVSSNISSPGMQLHNKGSLSQAVRASLSVPGLFPPVLINNEVHVDGGIFNNVPVDIMMTQNVGNILAVRVDKEEAKSTKNVKLPNLFTTFIKSTVANSDSKAEALADFVDLYFEPKVSRFGLLNWKKHDAIMQAGEQYANDVLTELPNIQLFQYNPPSERYVRIKDKVLNVFEDNWDSRLVYHNLGHTKDVLKAVKRACGEHNVQHSKAELLHIAALAHDVGFAKTYDGHEEVSVDLISSWMSKDYSADDIATVSRLIRATKLGNKPSDLLEEIMVDADLDYLGREDFSLISSRLYKEWVTMKLVEDDLVTFDRLQLQFLKNHQYYTKWSKEHRQPQVEKRIVEIEGRLGATAELG